jgi:hypothetical protein
MSRRYSSAPSSSGSNTKLLIIIGIFAFAIIVGTLIGSSYMNRENFTNSDKLVYLYMSQCGHCQNFTPIWNKMVDDINKDTTNKYKFITEKYNLVEDANGQQTAKENNIDYAPAILYISANNTAVVYEGERSQEKILQWAVSQSSK